MGLKQLKARWWLLRNHGKSLQKRVAVERYLYNCVEGKNPLPDKDKCRELANKLGMPPED